MKITLRNIRRRLAGFTLAEMIVSMAISTGATAACLVLFVSFLRSYNTTTLMRTGSTRTSFALDRMVFGVGTNSGLREAFGDSLVISNMNGGGWRVTYSNAATFYFQYIPDSKRIVTETGKMICTNVVAATFSTNSLTGGCQISITVAESQGGKTLTNTMGTVVEFRN